MEMAEARFITLGKFKNELTTHQFTAMCSLQSSSSKQTKNQVQQAQKGF